MTVDIPEDVARVEEELLAPGSPFALEEVEVLGERMMAFTTRHRTLYDILRNSAGFGDAEYIMATDGNDERRITFAEHLRLVASVAGALRDRYGVGRGDRVAILGANSPEWIITFWATIALGGVAVGLNGWSTGPEIQYFIEDSEPKVLVADRKRLERLEGADFGVPVVEIESDFAELERHEPDAPLPDVDVAEDDATIILYTSGTTGRPKGAINTHRNVCSLLALATFQGIRGVMVAAR